MLTVFVQTVVSMQCWTTHRDPTAFPNPETFDPERWLSQEPTAAMKTLFMPFSKGSRACLGKGLAMLELKLVVMTLLDRFKVELPAETTEESMELLDHFLALPKAGKCILRFEKIGG
jgi:cytochrome P450